MPVCLPWASRQGGLPWCPGEQRPDSYWVRNLHHYGTAVDRTVRTHQRTPILCMSSGHGCAKPRMQHLQPRELSRGSAASNRPTPDPLRPCLRSSPPIRRSPALPCLARTRSTPGSHCRCPGNTEASTNVRSRKPPLPSRPALVRHAPHRPGPFLAPSCWPSAHHGPGKIVGFYFTAPTLPVAPPLRYPYCTGDHLIQLYHRAHSCNDIQH